MTTMLHALRSVPVVGSHDVGFGQQVVDFGDRVFVRFGGAVGLFGVEREGQDHRERDFRVARTEGDGAVEVADQLLTMASPRPLLLSNWGRRSERWLNDSEDGLLLVVGDFRPGVGDREGDVFGAGGRRSGLRALVLPRRVDSHADIAVFRGVLDRVGEEVREDFFRSRRGRTWCRNFHTGELKPVSIPFLLA